MVISLFGLERSLQEVLGILERLSLVSLTPFISNTERLAGCDNFARRKMRNSRGEALNHEKLETHEKHESKQLGS